MSRNLTKSFMDIVNDQCFSCVYTHLDSTSKANLRLVSKPLRKAIDLNVRGLEAELDDDYEPVHIPLLVFKLPNLKSIIATVSYKSDTAINLLNGALSAGALSHLELSNAVELAENGDLLATSFAVNKQHSWPSLKYLDITGMCVASNTMEALKGMSNLTTLALDKCSIKEEVLNMIQPGCWPHLHDLCFDEASHPKAALAAALHLTQLKEFGMKKFQGEFTYNGGLDQIKPGDWPHLVWLDLADNDFSDGPAMTSLLHLTALTLLCLSRCNLLAETVSQIKPGSWPNLQSLGLGGNDLGDDPVEAMKALLHLTTLTCLDLSQCTLSVEAVCQTKAGNWPNLQILYLRGSNRFGDDPLEAMKALLHLTTLTELSLAQCTLSADAITQIKPGDWPRLQTLYLFQNSFAAQRVRVIKSLFYLTSLKKLKLSNCGLNGSSFAQIRPGDWPQLQELDLSNNALSDNPGEAVEALLQLPALKNVHLKGCMLPPEAKEQVKARGWNVQYDMKVGN